MRKSIMMGLAAMTIAAGCKSDPKPVAPVAADKPAATSEPREPTAREPGEPGEPTEPTAREPGEPTEPTGREPGEPTEPTGREPTEPTGREPTEPTEPTAREPEDGDPSDDAPADPVVVGGGAAPATGGGEVPAGLDFPLVFAAEERMPASDCEAMNDKEAALIRETGNDELKEALAKANASELIAKCRAAPYPKAVAECARQATSALQLYRECYTLPFRGRDLMVAREFKAGDPNNANAEPKMFSQHGDLIVIRDGCGLLFQRAEVFVGAFLICDGKTQGPFTTKGDIDAVFAAMAAEESARHNMMMGIIANYPSGGTGRYRVCNTAGVCHLE